MPMVTRRTRTIVAPANLLPTETMRAALALVPVLGESLASTRGPDGAAVLHVTVGALLAVRTETGQKAIGRSAGDHFAPAARADAGETGFHRHALGVALRIGVSKALRSAIT